MNRLPAHFSDALHLPDAFISALFVAYTVLIFSDSRDLLSLLWFLNPDVGVDLAVTLLLQLIIRYDIVFLMER